MPKNKAINLLPQEEFSTSTTGRVLRWATGTFRLIVIATEVVVMGAFLSRFWLDAQNSNLNNAIKIKSSQISAQSDLEKQFREIQIKLNIFDKISQTHNGSSLIEKISSNVPQNIVLTRISLSKGGIQVSGTTASDSEIIQFVNSLGVKPFKSADLGQVTTSKDSFGLTDFVINLTY